MAEPKETRTVEIIVNGQRANASLKEMSAAVAVLTNQFNKMAADDPARAGLLKQLQGMKARVAEVRQEVAGVAETTGVMKQAFANAFALFTGGGLIGLAQQLFGFFQDSRQEALASAKSSADLENTLKSTAHAAGLTAEEIRRIGTERAKVTLFDDDDTNAASALLLTFTNIKKGVFEQAMPAIQDLATKMGGDGPADMKGATVQLGKALNDPIKGITALTRVGVSFTEQQKEQITQMVKAGNVAGAQQLILAEMNKEFGGTAEAARKAAGGVATLAMGWNEFKETVGGKVNEVLGALSQWLGRIIDKSQPLVDMFSELADQVTAFYHEIGDVLEGLGLFSEKTDTVGVAIEALKFVLTLALLPIKTLYSAAKGMVDVFIDWYNKSELLRGILGGLGAVVVSLFTTIKDDALKILGGVGDIIIGIFSLDRAKIAAGFKAALAGTGDLALEAGNKAAEAFKKGFEANKNNHITRTKLQVSAEEEKTEKLGPVTNDPAGETAADKKAREAREKRAAAEAARKLKAREAAELKEQEALYNLAQAAKNRDATEREKELADIEFAALRKTLTVTGSEKQKQAAITLIMQEAEQKRQALLAKFDAQDKESLKKSIEQKLADIEAGEVEQEAALEDAFQEALTTEKERNRNLWNVRLSAADAKLNYLETALGKESAEYRKAYKEQEKLQKDANKAKLEEDKKAHKAKIALEQAGLAAASDVLSFTLGLLDQDTQARKEHHSLYVALATGKVLAEGIAEVQAIWSTFSEMGPVGVVLAGIQTALAAGRTAVAIGKIRSTTDSGSGGSYWAGGATGTGAGLAVSPMGQLLALSGMSIGSNGQLNDGSGFAVAGIVHEDEYVVPKWLRADPQVAAVEQWLEARRLRGFAAGGATSSGSSGAALPVAAASPNSDGEKLYAVMAQVLDANLAMVQQLGDVKRWQANLQVQLNLREAQTKTDQFKQVQYNSAIRSKS